MSRVAYAALGCLFLVAGCKSTGRMNDCAFRLADEMPRQSTAQAANDGHIIIFGSAHWQRIPYSPGLTVIQALRAAGVQPQKWPKKVMLVRPSLEGEPVARALVDFERMSQSSHASQDYLLEPGDVIDILFTHADYFGPRPTDTFVFSLPEERRGATSKPSD